MEGNPVGAFRRVALGMFGGFLLLGGLMFVGFAVVPERGHRVTFTAFPEGKVGAVHEEIGAFGTKTLEHPPGSVRGATDVVEKRTGQTTGPGGKGTRSYTYDVTVLKLDWDGEPKSFGRADAPTLARQIRDLRTAPPGTKVLLERPYEWWPAVVAGAMLVLGALLLWRARGAPSELLAHVQKLQPPQGPA